MRWALCDSTYPKGLEQALFDLNERLQTKCLILLPFSKWIEYYIDLLFIIAEKVSSSWYNQFYT